MPRYAESGRLNSSMKIARERMRFQATKLDPDLFNSVSGCVRGTLTSDKGTKAAAKSQLASLRDL